MKNRLVDVLPLTHYLLIIYLFKCIVNCNCNLFTHGALRSSFKNLSVNYWSLKVLVFEVHGKPEYVEKNLLEGRTENQQ